MVFGVFSPGRTQCIAPKKLPDKAMSIWNLHKKFQLSSAMGLRDFDLQSQPTLMGGNPLIVVQWGQKRHTMFVKGKFRAFRSQWDSTTGATGASGRRGGQGEGGGGGV